MKGEFVEGIRVHRYRMKKRISQRKLAEILNTHQSLISRWERIGFSTEIWWGPAHRMAELLKKEGL